MSRPVVFFDFEATGVDPYNDRIVEFCFAGPMAEPFVGRVNPGIPIPPDSTEIHGISDADVADCPPFEHFAPLVQDIVNGAVLCGYSCRRYDTVLLHTGLIRADQPGLACDSAGRIIAPEIDLFEIWLRHENRRLVTAAKRFAGVDLEQAHSADADTLVLPAVLEGMREAFALPESVDELCALSIPEGAIDRDGKFVKNGDGVACFNFGKSRGQPAVGDVGLLEWVMRQPFMTPETKAVAEVLYRRATRQAVA